MIMSLHRPPKVAMKTQLIFFKQISTNEAIVSLHRPPKSCDEETQVIYCQQILSYEAIVLLLRPHKNCDEAIVSLLSTHVKIAIGS